MTERVESALDGCLLGAIWLLSGGLGAIIGLIGLLGIIDPVGSQHANDADPFGTPPSVGWSSILVVVGIALAAWPLPIVIRRGGHFSPRGTSRVDAASEHG